MTKRLRFMSYALLLYLVIPVISQAGFGTVTSIGPSGGRVQCVLPIDTNSFYACSRSGALFYGVRDGTYGVTNWSVIQNDSLTTSNVLIRGADEGASQVFYVGSTSGVYKLTKTGTSYVWQNFNGTGGSSLSGSVSALIYLGSENALYASVPYVGVYRGAIGTGGIAWTSLNGTTLTGAALNVTSLIIGPDGNLYAGTRSGVFKGTVTGGSLGAGGVITWSDVSGGSLVGDALSINVLMRIAENLFIGTRSGVYKGVITGGAVTWSEFSNTTGLGTLTGLDVTFLVPPGAAGPWWFAGTSGQGIFKGTVAPSGSITWADESGSGETGLSGFARNINYIVPNTEGRMFIGTDAGVYVQDFGVTATWQNLNGIGRRGLNNLMINDISLARNGDVFAGTEIGVLKASLSTDGNFSWSDYNGSGSAALPLNARSSIKSLRVSQDGRLYLGTLVGVFRGTVGTGSVSWTAINTGLSGASLAVNSIDFSPAGIPYVSTYGGVYKGIITGDSIAWNDVSGTVLTGAVLPVTSMLFRSDNFFYAATSDGVYKGLIVSGITNWTPVNGVGSTELPVGALAVRSIVSDSDTSLFIASTVGVFKGVVSVTNIDWTPFNGTGPTGLTGLAANVSKLDVSSGYLVASTSGGAFSSRLEAASWEPAIPSVPNDAVNVIRVSLDYIPSVYVGTSSYSIYHFASIGCGDRFIEVDLGETCDDGNITSGDGCSSTCHIETPGTGGASGSGASSGSGGDVGSGGASGGTGGSLGSGGVSGGSGGDTGLPGGGASGISGGGASGGDGSAGTSGGGVTPGEGAGASSSGGCSCHVTPEMY